MTAPLLTFAEAEAVGRKLQARWEAMAGTTPLPADDLAWADIVQFVLRKARDVADERVGSGE